MRTSTVLIIIIIIAACGDEVPTRKKQEKARKFSVRGIVLSLFMVEFRKTCISY